MRRGAIVAPAPAAAGVNSPTDMFDIGFWELAVIMVVALIVIGPERLPGLARKAGYWLGRGRRFVQSVKSDIDREIAADELRRVLKEQADSSGVHEIVEQTREAVDDTRASLRETREKLEQAEAEFKDAEHEYLVKATSSQNPSVADAPNASSEPNKTKKADKPASESPPIDDQTK